MQPKSITLLQKIDFIIEQILTKFQDIFESLKNDTKPKELLSIESLSIENNANQIIRLCQDLLSISRNIKETWILSSLKVENGGKEDPGEDENVDRVFQLFNELTENISKFESPQVYG
ncbi:uncharacterized protein KGF55_000540 [Candida pseudojiufengensis]|uniref:uncharacterized protein n=1 Tax=Candida pseudojiufengensis TaxID=497109 RepID=UPI002223FA76|nr:uncharacterized protein KGF55_000540 [Candida pseudojiufengensis]KAI5966231.1 hypothetical protein KGF55_000540 [Candida pseudojiufengensis]